MKPRERDRKVQNHRLTVMDVVACPPLFRFQIHVAQAADLVIVCQTLHRPVHDSNSTGDGALQDRRQVCILSQGFLGSQRTQTDGFLSIKAAKPPILQSVQTQA